MIEIEHSRNNNVITLRASGTLTKADDDTAVPEIENAMVLADVPLKMLLRLEDFHGWALDALWNELAFELKHRGEFGSIAVVGDTKLKEWGTLLSSIFPKSDIRFFHFETEDKARDWLQKSQILKPKMW